MRGGEVGAWWKRMVMEFVKMLKSFRAVSTAQMRNSTVSLTVGKRKLPAKHEETSNTKNNSGYYSTCPRLILGLFVVGSILLTW